MQRISQSLTGNHALSWLLKMPSIKKKMPSLSTNQRSVILPFIDNNSYARLFFFIIPVFFCFVSVPENLYTIQMLAVFDFYDRM